AHRGPVAAQGHARRAVDDEVERRRRGRRGNVARAIERRPRTTCDTEDAHSQGERGRAAHLSGVATRKRLSNLAYFVKVLNAAYVWASPSFTFTSGSWPRGSRAAAMSAAGSATAPLPPGP